MRARCSPRWRRPARCWPSGTPRGFGGKAGARVDKGPMFVLVLGGAYVAGFVDAGFLRPGETVIVRTALEPSEDQMDALATGVLACRDTDENTWIRRGYPSHPAIRSNMSREPSAVPSPTAATTSHLARPRAFGSVRLRSYGRGRGRRRNIGL